MADLIKLSTISKAKVTDNDFINFLIAKPLNATILEVERTQPIIGAMPIAHDA